MAGEGSALAGPDRRPVLRQTAPCARVAGWSAADLASFALRLRPWRSRAAPGGPRTDRRGAAVVRPVQPGL